MHYFYRLVIAEYYVLAVLWLYYTHMSGCVIIGWGHAVPRLTGINGGVAAAVLPTTHSSCEEAVEYYNIVLCLYGCQQLLTLTLYGVLKIIT